MTYRRIYGRQYPCLLYTSPGEHILVLSTTATINGKRLKKSLKELKDKAEITALAAPGLVPFVENEKTGSEEFSSYLKALLAPYKKDTDAVVLGCTHFPFVKAQLKECFDKDIILSLIHISAIREELRYLRY